MRAVLFYHLVLLLQCSCDPAPQDAAPVTSLRTSAADPIPPPIGTGTLDTAQAYRAAITDYIKAMRKRDGSFPDTVYIGRHDQFPHIGLPAIIEHTAVRIVTPAEAEPLKSGEHFTYLNIFGWFTSGQAEFLVVNFKQGMSHRPDGHDDCHLYYGIGTGQKDLALDSLKF